MSTNLTQVESQMAEGRIDRRESRTYQIFPRANMDKDSDHTSFSEEFLYRRERLPSIVVQPTELNELASGEMCWRPRFQMSSSVDDEENNSPDNTLISLKGEQQEDMAMGGSVIARKSSIGPSHCQLSISRLTPPPSPTHPEAAPPCLNNLTNATTME